MTDGLPDDPRRKLLDLVVEEVPRDLWSDWAAGVRAAYPDCFSGAENDPFCPPLQRRELLQQTRHFRCEGVMQQAMQRHGVSVSDTLIMRNGRHYSYASTPSIGLSQAYVAPNKGAPNSRSFRDRLSQANAMWSQGSLALFPEETELREPKSFYGFLAHSPIGQTFEEDEQRCGLVELWVPHPDCRSMLATFTVSEIVAEYDARRSEARRIARRPERRPTLKPKHQGDEKK